MLKSRSNRGALVFRSHQLAGVMKPLRYTGATIKAIQVLATSGRLEPVCSGESYEMRSVCVLKSADRLQTETEGKGGVGECGCKEMVVGEGYARHAGDPRTDSKHTTHRGT